MKLRSILFIIIVSISIFAGFTNSWSQQERFPKPIGYVNDFARILPEENRLQLENLASELERKTTAQIAVVTLESTKPLDIETYAVELFENWGIGKKGKDNGVLILVAVRDRRVRIEVGYGLEGAIPDAIAKGIINDHIIPFFRQGDYTQGIMAGSIAVCGSIAREYNVKLSSLQDLPKALSFPEKPSPISSAFQFIFLLLFVLLFLGLRMGFLWWWLLIPGTYRRRGGYWYGGGYGGNSGGFSGGFGGFGGGLSGGGGASGGW